MEAVAQANSSAITQAATVVGASVKAVRTTQDNQFSDSVNLTISAASIERLKQDLAKLDEPKTEEQIAAQAATKARFLADRAAYLQRETAFVDMSHPLFSDPQTGGAALSVSALIGMAKPEDMSAVADAVYAAISSPVQQWTDTTEAVDIASKQMKLNAVMQQMIPAEQQERVGKVINNYINGLVEHRNAFSVQMLESLQSLRSSLGDTRGAAEAARMVQQAKQGTYQSQREMSQALQVANSLDFTSSASLNKTADAAFEQLRSLVQSSMPNTPADTVAYWVGQVSLFQQSWQSVEAMATQA